MFHLVDSLSCTKQNKRLPTPWVQHQTQEWALLSKFARRDCLQHDRVTVTSTVRTWIQVLTPPTQPLDFEQFTGPLQALPLFYPDGWYQTPVLTVRITWNDGSTEHRPQHIKHAQWPSATVIQQSDFDLSGLPLYFCIEILFSMKVAHI